MEILMAKPIWGYSYLELYVESWLNLDWQDVIKNQALGWRENHCLGKLSLKMESHLPSSARIIQVALIIQARGRNKNQKPEFMIRRRKKKRGKDAP